MAIRFIRQPSETPNVTNADDARMVRYAYGGYDGYVAGKGSELSYSADGNIFRVNSGVINLQGWETEIDSNGWEMTVDNVAGSRYYAVYYEVNLSTQTTAIKSSYDTAGIPNIAAGDDLTAVSAGTGRMVLYTFRAQNGAISDVQKVVRAIPYSEERISDIEERLNRLGFSEADATIFSNSGVSSAHIKRQGNYAILDVVMNGAPGDSLFRLPENYRPASSLTVTCGLTGTGITNTEQTVPVIGTFELTIDSDGYAQASEYQLVPVVPFVTVQILDEISGHYTIGYESSPRI
nr:MAG TPA: hypothetical protein [Caudoviricetes sp.]